ncbi:MAG: hypothetical protein HKN19_00625 [Halioglobus sp.]|nr:hypothetical protein [Halioglobus sp.]
MRVRALFLALVLGAAAAVPLNATADARDDFVAAQKERARKLREQDQLAYALAVWRTVLPLGAPDAETRTAVAELERTITARVKSLESRARQAYNSGRSNDGDTYLLKLLALQPGHPGALKRLRRSHSVFAQRQQQEKSEAEYRTVVRKEPVKKATTLDQLLALEQRGEYSAMLALADKSGSTDAASARLLRGAHTALADEAERRGDLDKALEHMDSAMLLQPVSDDPLLTRSAELRAQLSASWYRKGTQLIQSDLPGAIAALEKAVAYNPYNNNARRKLDQAQTLQRNLDRIESRR